MEGDILKLMSRLAAMEKTQQAILRGMVNKIESLPDSNHIQQINNKTDRLESRLIGIEKKMDTFLSLAKFEMSSQQFQDEIQRISLSVQCVERELKAVKQEQAASKIMKTQVSNVDLESSNCYESDDTADNSEVESIPTDDLDYCYSQLLKDDNKSNKIVKKSEKVIVSIKNDINSKENTYNSFKIFSDNNSDVVDIGRFFEENSSKQLRFGDVDADDYDQDYDTLNDCDTLESDNPKSKQVQIETENELNTNAIEFGDVTKDLEENKDNPSTHDDGSLNNYENKTLEFGEATKVYQELILDSAIDSNSKADKILFDANTKENNTQISHIDKNTQKSQILKINMDHHKTDKLSFLSPNYGKPGFVEEYWFEFGEATEILRKLLCHNSQVD